MNNHHQIPYALLVVLLLSSLVLPGCASLAAQPTPTVEPEMEKDFKPVVSATASVVPSRWAKLSFSVNGLVEEVLVTEGQQVEAGQVLARLRGEEDLQAAISTAELQVETAQKALEDLTENAEDASVIALEKIAAAAKLVRDARYQLDNYTIPPAQKDLTAIEGYDQMKVRLDAARDAYEPFRKQGNSDLKDDLKERLDNAQSDYNSAVKRLNYEIDLSVAEANLDKARKDYETLKDGPDPDEVALAQNRLEDARVSLAAAGARLTDLELKAPFSGSVTELYARAGEWLSLGQPVLLLADLAGLRIETTDLNEIDMAQVRLGDSAAVTFDALPELQVNGKVVYIAPKASEGSGVNYKLVVEMEQVPVQLRWGMSAFVDVQIQK